MKILVLGGTSGLGAAIVSHFNADHVSRTTGHAIPDAVNQVVEKSLNYDIIVNCIPDSNQNKILFSMFEAHHNQGLKTYFITVGSMSWRFKESGHSKRDLFDWNESILLKPTSVKHTLLNPAYLWNSNDQAPIEKISEQEMIETIDFLIKQGYNRHSVISLLEIKGSFKC